MEPIVNGRGRRIKFTPERIEQIRNLVEHGTPREEIASIIDVTVGSLQVTCSKLGISLRKKKLLALPDDNPPGNGPKLPPQRREERERNGSVLHASFSLIISLRDGREKRLLLNLPPEIITQIALEATMRNVSIADVVASRIIAGGWVKD